MKKRTARAQALIDSWNQDTSLNESYSLAKEMRKKNEAEAIAENERIENLHATKKAKALQERRAFISNLKSFLIESFLNHTFDKGLGNRSVIISEDTKNLNRSLVKAFVQEEGVDSLLATMKYKSNMLAEVADHIEKTIDNEVNDYDEEVATSSDSELADDLFNKLDGSQDYNDVTEIIRSRVSQATQNFIQKNMVDKLDIKDMMATTKEKIDAVRTGDPDKDEQIRQEQTFKMKRAIREMANRPHSIYEQLVINLTEGVLKNDKVKEKFTNESGRLNMDAIVERATSFYLMLEMVNSLQLKKMDHEYIQEAIKMQ